MNDLAMSLPTHTTEPYICTQCHRTLKNTGAAITHTKHNTQGCRGQKVLLQSEYHRLLRDQGQYFTAIWTALTPSYSPFTWDSQRSQRGRVNQPLYLPQTTQRPTFSRPHPTQICPSHFLPRPIRPFFSLTLCSKHSMNQPLTNGRCPNSALLLPIPIRSTPRLIGSIPRLRSAPANRPFTRRSLLVPGLSGTRG
jgi:hypothetical protein